MRESNIIWGKRPKRINKGFEEIRLLEKEKAVNAMNSMKMYVKLGG